ncbi:MAG TPA: hypothetical protein VN598_13375 [Usitatibacter sp.]|nr:hypothetical protein [Usitatibacter sp.]
MARTRISFPDPFGGWGTLAWKSAEMLAASALVIPHRARRANTPAQLMEMGGEKYMAALEAWSAMSRHWMRMGAVPRAPSLDQWAAFWTSGVRPFHRRAVANSRKAGRRR